MRFFLFFLTIACLAKFFNCSVIFETYVYLGESIELRCKTNESSKFTRIQHRLPNGTIETLLSNDILNTEYQNSELHIEKHTSYYVIKIDPVKLHSAGTYICEDDVSMHNLPNHMSNVTLHVIGMHKVGSPIRMAKEEAESLRNFQNNFQRVEKYPNQNSECKSELNATKK